MVHRVPLMEATLAGTYRGLATHVGRERQCRHRDQKRWINKVQNELKNRGFLRVAHWMSWTGNTQHFQKPTRQYRNCSQVARNPQPIRFNFFSFLSFPRFHSALLGTTHLPRGKSKVSEARIRSNFGAAIRGAI